MPTASEVARKLVEENATAVQRPYWRALGFDVRIGENGPELVELEEGGAKLYGTHSGAVIVSNHDDLGLMMQASERLQDRVNGKPKQTAEVSRSRDPVSVDARQRVRNLRKLSIEEREKLAELTSKVEAAAHRGHG